MTKTEFTFHNWQEHRVNPVCSRDDLDQPGTDLPSWILHDE